MTERAHLVRLELAVCALGATILLTMLVVAVDALRFHGGEWLSPASIVVAAEALALGFMVASLTRQIWRQHALAPELPAMSVVILGTPVQLIHSASPHAFTLGFLRPRIVLSDGLVDLLDDEELACVLAHARRRDPLRRALVKAICDGFRFLPPLRHTAYAHAAISELAADAVAIRSTGARSLASALVAFEEHGGENAGATPERVRHLLGELGRPAGERTGAGRRDRDRAVARRSDRPPAAPCAGGVVPAALDRPRRPAGAAAARGRLRAGGPARPRRRAVRP